MQFDEPIIPPCEPWNVMEKLSKEKEMIGIYISGHPLDDFKTEIQYFCNARVDSLQNISQLEGKELSFAGIITDVQHRVSKNGKPWGMFTFEDYSDAYEFRLFNEDYLKFRHYLNSEHFFISQNGDAKSMAKRRCESQILLLFNSFRMYWVKWQRRSH